VKIKHIEEFKQEAVQIAPTNGLTCERVAKDLGIGAGRVGHSETSIHRVKSCCPYGTGQTKLTIHPEQRSPGTQTIQ
jgi:hypothetical protein